MLRCLRSSAAILLQNLTGIIIIRLRCQVFVKPDALLLFLYDSWYASVLISSATSHALPEGFEKTSTLEILERGVQGIGAPFNLTRAS